MPTKPLVTITEWASDLTWSIGPKVGQNTKFDYSGIAAQGHIPGIDNPSTANEQNDYQSKMSLVAQWVMAGSSSKLLEARIVEADASGSVGIAALDCGGTTSAVSPALFKENTGTNAASVLATSGNNDGIRSEAEAQFALVARSRGQAGSGSFYTAEVDGNWNDGSNPLGQSGGMRILANSDEVLAPVPPAQHPLRSRGLFVRNAVGVGAEIVGVAPDTLDVNAALVVRNYGLRGDGIHVNALAGLEPIGGSGVVSHGGGAFFDAGTPANSILGGHGVIGRGGLTDLAGNGLIDAQLASGGAGVVGYGSERVNTLFGTAPGGAGIHGISEATVGAAPAGLFQRLATGSLVTESTVRIETNVDQRGLRGLDVISGEAVGIRVTSGGDPCLELLPVLTQFTGTTETYGAHIAFRNSTNPDPSDPLDGDLWNSKESHGGAGTSNFLKIKYTGLEDDKRYIPHYHHSPIRHQVEAAGDFTSGDNTDEVVMAAFTFDSRLLPRDTPRIAYRMDFRFRMRNGGTTEFAPHNDIAFLRLYDMTLGGSFVTTRGLSYMAGDLNVSETGPWMDFNVTLLYTIPTGGQRSFEMRMVSAKSPGDVPAMDIKDLQLEVFTWVA